MKSIDSTLTESAATHLGNDTVGSQALAGAEEGDLTELFIDGDLDDNPLRVRQTASRHRGR